MNPSDNTPDLESAPVQPESDPPDTRPVKKINPFEYKPPSYWGPSDKKFGLAA